jgi:hypothetical protein
VYTSLMWSSVSGWAPTNTVAVDMSSVAPEGGLEAKADSTGVAGSNGLFASKLFTAGTTILKEAPLLWWPDAAEGERVCSWCLDPIEEPGEAVYTQIASPRGCGSGCDVGWCSYICQRQDEVKHARLCGFMAAGRAQGLDDETINLLQLVIKTLELRRYVYVW